MIVENRLRIFNAFLTEFPKDRPVTKYLPEYFKRNKQMGSRDRKNLSKAIYSYFRLGNCLAGLKLDERLFVALFLTSNSPDDMLAYFKPDYQERITDGLAEKAAYLTSVFPEFNLNDIFPFTAHLSSSIDQSLFISSQLIQPDLFIRAIKGAEQKLAACLNLTSRFSKLEALLSDAKICTLGSKACNNRLLPPLAAQQSHHICLGFG